MAYTYIAFTTRLPDISDEAVNELLQRFVDAVKLSGGTSTDCLFSMMKDSYDNGSSLRRVEKGYMIVCDELLVGVNGKFDASNETEVR